MKVLFPFYFILIPFITMGQDPVHTQDPNAEPYLEKISENFRTGEAFQVEFRYEIYSARQDAKVGDFGSIIVKDSMYKLTTEDSEVIYNGKYLWIYNKLTEEVYRSEPEEGDLDQMLADPFRLLGSYKEYYKYLYKGKKTIAGTEYSEIDLYPVSLESGYSYLRILCRAMGDKIYSLSMHQKNGTEITAYLTDLIEGIKVPDSVFSWNPEDYPDVLLIEM